MTAFNPSDYGPVFEKLLTDRRAPLDEGSPGRLGGEAAGLSVDEAFAHTSVLEDAMARCCVAGVLLLDDRLDASHTISQSVGAAEGSFWHGVMHRREGDYSNAKYWFRRVGSHPVLDQLAERFEAWDPYDFVDRCQAAVRRGTDAEECLDQQQAEWEALFDWCYHAAVSG